MSQVDYFLAGENRYSKLTGPTGPLVYPAFHVYIYSALYYVTDHGNDIMRAQIIFAVLYLVTLSLVIACYRRVNAPPWLLIPLVLSKRLHSIFLLRLFNDAWAALAFWATVYLLQRRYWQSAATTWTLGVGIKMTMLLPLPAMALILVQGTGLEDSIFLGVWTILLQAGMAFPFFSRETGFQYVVKAFDFGRRFMFKWTVNWRFVGEDMFSSRSFASSLLVLHVSILLYFIHTRWVRPSSSGLGEFLKKWITGPMSEKEGQEFSRKITPVFVMDAMLASMVAGLLCARSLHYQFYAYLGWATPYLLWRAGGGPIWVLANWAVQEYCWLVYPSTELSSAIVVVELAIQVLCALVSPPVDHISRPAKLAAKTR